MEGPCIHAKGPCIHVKGRRNERRVYASETKIETARSSKNVSSYLFTKDFLCFQTRKWFSLSDNMLYVHETAISPRKIPFIECDLRLCDLAVVEASNRFMISPPALRTTVFTARNKQEFRQWVQVLGDVIYSQAGKRRVPTGMVRMVCLNPRCADCRAPCPYFLVLNLGILVCKQCATIHRTLGRGWKVCSLPASPELWRASWAALVAAIGNKQSNSIWEVDIGDCNKPQPLSVLEAKQCWIYAKYLSRSFIDRHLMLDRKDPSERLFEAACRGSAKGVIAHFAAGANMKWIDERGNTALHVASRKSLRACLRLLLTHDVDVWARNNDGLTARDLAPNQAVSDILAQAEQLRPRMQRVHFIRGYHDDDVNGLNASLGASVYGEAASAFGYGHAGASAEGDDSDSDDDADSEVDGDGGGADAGGVGSDDSERARAGHGSGDIGGGGGGGDMSGNGATHLVGEVDCGGDGASADAVAEARSQTCAAKATTTACTLLGPATRVIVRTRGRP